MENKQLQLVIILKTKEDMTLLNYGTFYKRELTGKKLLQYFSRYMMNEVVSEG